MPPAVLTPAEVLRETEIQASPPVAVDAARKVAEAFEAAQRPLILAGQGTVVSGAGPALREVGDRIGALFTTSVMATGVFGSPWDLGVAGGFASARAAKIIGEADVVLAAGASLNLYQMRYTNLLSHAQTVIQIDNVAKPTHVQVTDFHRADVADFAQAPLAELGPEKRPGWRATVARSP